MRIGIDLDFTITGTRNSVEFFSDLTNSLKGKHQIFIITNREPGTEKAVAELLRDMKVYYDFLILTGEKAKFIDENNINIFFDDTDEYILDVPANVIVFKIRDEINFDYQDKKWLYNERTGKKV